MKSFFDSNPGLKSRFNTFIEFNDYDVDELIIIFQQMCNRDDYKLSDDVKAELAIIINKELEKQQENFANGRYVRNLYEEVIINQAIRLDAKGSQTLEDLQCLSIQDLPNIDVNPQT